MALSSRIQSIFIREEGGGGFKYELTPNNFNIEHEDVYWNDSPFDEALDGSLRQNFRGYRVSITLTWEKTTDSTVKDQFGSNTAIGTMLGDFKNALVDNQDDTLEISVDNELSWDGFIPTNLGKIVRFNNQIASAGSTLEFIKDSIDNTVLTQYQNPSV